MRSAAVSSLVGTLIAGFACTTPPAPVADNSAALAALKEADAAYARAGVARDLEAFVAFYAQDASSHPPGEPPVTGVAAIRTYLGRYFQDAAFAATFQPVSAVVSRRVPLTRAGREWKGLYPFHKDKTPSFTVNDQEALVHCFPPGQHGDRFAFRRGPEGLCLP